MQAQVVLDRHGFSPGVIDGKMGMSTNNAIEGFQEANELRSPASSTKRPSRRWRNGTTSLRRAS